VRTPQHRDDHRQRDQQRAQDARVEPAIAHLLQRVGDVAQQLRQSRQQQEVRVFVDHLGEQLSSR
jgi:hypothetical protein